MKRPKVIRKTYELTEVEQSQLLMLRGIPGVAFAFWRRVAERLEVDFRTILAHATDRTKFTALPEGHGQWWCFPAPLKCLKKPVQ